ncbi:MAG: 2-C-methyl-D-erythritol 2,4-cyclodiphosphate synthase [Vallitaleaceae bacterium]|jgi:2-C-methyl-D-erythritol 2,4-cyclodiphosphate synthase|nr:2-C-methyl-D-erythritol 2,4-cyclodiphosphate synthase [Vallitaleaceae bacterium]
MRIGIGYDVHRLVIDRPLIIGGVDIDHEMGLLGHSDADVLIHAAMDAIIGAMGLGDIGKHFPDTEVRYQGISSSELLQEVKKLMDEHGYRIGNLDATIIAQMPKMAPHINEMASNIAKVLDCDASQINIKATTEEKLGFTGRGEGISANAVVLLKGD